MLIKKHQEFSKTTDKSDISNEDKKIYEYAAPASNDEQKVRKSRS